MSQIMTAKARDRAMADRKPRALTPEELKEFEERANEARSRDNQFVDEFLSNFEKDYRANIKERKRASGK